MKKHIALLTFFLCLGLSFTFAQKKASAFTFNTGTVIKYTSADEGGNPVSLALTLASAKNEGVVFNYKMSKADKSITGKMSMPASSLETGTKLNWGGLSPGEDRQLAGDETIFFFSKKFLSELKAKKSASYSDDVLTILPDAKSLSINGSSVKNVFSVASKKTGTKYWILDNDNFPLLLKVEGNKRGPDLTVSEITSK